MGNRSYAAVPYEYLKTMQKLSDAEFGRLMRGLLEYSETGAIPELSGREDMFWDTVQVKEEQFQISFERVDAQNSERAKKAASARWADVDSNAQGCSSMLKDAQACSRMLDDAQGCLESQFKNKNKIKNKNNSPNGEIKRARKAAKKAPEPPTLEEVKAYCAERNSSVDPVQFWEYFDTGKWKDSEGKPVLSWKQKLLTWEKSERSKPQSRYRTPSAAEYNQRDKRTDFSVLDTALDSI